MKRKTFLLLLCIFSLSLAYEDVRSRRQIIFPPDNDSSNQEDIGGKSLVQLLLGDLSDYPRAIGSHGRGCYDPDGFSNGNGVCSYISEPQCDQLRRDLGLGTRRKRRSDSRIRQQQSLRQIRRAIVAPCGYDGVDINICCPVGDSEGPPPLQLPPQIPHTTAAPRPPPIPRTTAAPRPTPSPLTQLPKACGMRQRSVSSLFGGTEAPEGHWPWAVVLGEPLSGQQQQQPQQQRVSFRVTCGGTLITDQHVLTAAHCFPPQPKDGQRITHVRLGQQNLASSSSPTTAVDVEVCDVIKHEDYVKTTEAKNDVAVIKLCRPVTFGLFIQPVCLPSGSDQVAGALKQGLTIVGWGSEQLGGGAVSALREADVVVVPLSECQERYSKIGGRIDSSHICAGRGKTDTCAGDSGGPMMTLTAANGAWSVVGVTSFGVGCGSETFPGVYSNVTHFLEWIKGKLLLEGGQQAEGLGLRDQDAGNDSSFNPQIGPQ